MRGAVADAVLGLVALLLPGEGIESERGQVLDAGGGRDGVQTPQHSVPVSLIICHRVLLGRLGVLSLHSSALVCHQTRPIAAWLSPFLNSAAWLPQCWCGLGRVVLPKFITEVLTPSTSECDCDLGSLRR